MNQDTVALPNSVLMLACYFPPMVAPACGRSLSFAKYLPDHGYSPAILTAPTLFDYPADVTQLEALRGRATLHRPRADSLLRYIRTRRGRWPPDVWSHSPATQEHLRLAAEIPPCAPHVMTVVAAGLDLAERRKPSLIWATAPPIDWSKAASEISRITGIPLIVDYRDPLTYGVLSVRDSREVERRERWWERRILTQSTRVVFASRWTHEQMANRYPEFAEKFLTISSGFDGAVWDVDEQPVGERLMISHVGTIYAHRSPDVFLDALRLLVDESPEVAAQLAVRFVGRCSSVQELAAQRGLADRVQVLPTVSVAESRSMMRGSHVLLHLPSLDEASKDCVAGKIYDYFAAGRPILAIVMPGSGDDQLLREAGVKTLGIHDPRAVADALRDLWSRWRAGALSSEINSRWVSQFDMRLLTKRLADVMDDVVLRVPPRLDIDVRSP